MKVKNKKMVMSMVCFLVAGYMECAIPDQVFAAEKPTEMAKESTTSVVGQDSSFYDRIMNILSNPPKLEYPPERPAENRETPIFGAPEVSKEQIISFVRRYNPVPKLNCSLEDIVDMYYDEAGHEGVRPDLAIAQALLETAFFRYGGDVLPEQNNFAGIGTTGAGSRGIWFETPRLGVRAHIQHLLAYSTSRDPLLPIADPRFYLARDIHFSQCPSWESLSGKWAVPGVNYGQNILKILERIKNT